MGAQGLFEHFLRISAIPRESGQEKGISDFLVTFAAAHGLKVRQDDSNNVVIEKPGTNGREGAPPVFLQAHMDMVCEKTPGSPHDFAREGIEVVIDDDGDTVHARGTSLGADNGIGVATILDVLESDFPHPPLICLFTADEERGMAGVKNLDLTPYPGTMLVNLDSEEEGVFFASCAGSVRCAVTLPVTHEADGKNAAQELAVTVTGLKGGHSGLEIDKEHANAILVLGCVLQSALEKAPFSLRDISGGGKENSIPAQASAVIACEKGAETAIQAAINEAAQDIRAEYGTTDPDITVTLEAAGKTAPHTFAIPPLDTRRLLDLLLLLPNGQIKRDLVNDSPLASSNIGVIRLESGSAYISAMLRGNRDSAKQHICDGFTAAARLAGAEVAFTNGYSAWEYKAHSRLRAHFIKVYQEEFGVTPKVKSIHGGLECAYFAQKRPGLDMISIGCTLKDVHSVQERMSLSSAERTVQFLKTALERL